MDENIIKKCTVVRHKLHQMAEPSNKEIETKKFLIEFLEKNSCLLYTSKKEFLHFKDSQ